MYVQGNFAYQISPNWSIGGGPIWGHSSVELIQSIDLSPLATSAATGAPTFGQLGIATGTEFARLRLKGDANAWGAQIGISGHPSPEWMIGARFLTPIEFKYNDADAVFTQVPTGLTIGGTVQAPFSQGTPVDALVAPQFATGGAAVESERLDTKITHPAQVQAGVAYTGFKSWLLEADYAWVGWKRFDVLPITFNGPANANSRVLLENYNNSSAIDWRAEYTTSDHGLKVRGRVLGRRQRGTAGDGHAAAARTGPQLLDDRSGHALRKELRRRHRVRAHLYRRRTRSHRRAHADVEHRRDGGPAEQRRVRSVGERVLADVQVVVYPLGPLTIHQETY